MKLEKSILDDHQAQVVVELESERVEAARRRAARKLASRGKIPGFRPGKAPYDVIVRHYGEPAVYEEAIDLLVDEVYPEMLKDADINPAAAGLLEKVEGTDLPKLTFRVPLAPEVVLGDYREIRAPYEYQPPGSDKLEQALTELQQMYATTETVERAVEAGDFVLMDLNSATESLKRTGFAAVVRAEDRQDEIPFPGFSRQLVGLKAGDSKKILHEFPQDIVDAALAGQNVEIEAIVKAVRSMTLPALDDAFAKTVGNYESLASLKNMLTKEIEDRARAEYDDEYFTKLVDKIREGAGIKYAPQTLEHEAEHVVDEMRQRLAQQRLDLETYYKMRNTTAEKFLEDEAKPVARKRLERSLILDEVARQEKIEVDNGALDQEFNSTLIDLQSRGLKLNAIRGGKQGQQRVAEAVAVQSASRLLTRRSLERLKQIATGEYHPEDADATGNTPQVNAEAHAAGSNAPLENSGGNAAAIPESSGKSAVSKVKSRSKTAKSKK